MSRNAVALTLAGLALIALGAGAVAATAGDSAADPSAAAVAYANALAEGKTAAAWDLLSSESRGKISAADWQQAFSKASSVRRPPTNSLIQALASEQAHPLVSDVLVRPGQALIRVSGSLPVTQEIVLVRESVGWRVDLAATDEINSRAAAASFMEALNAQAQLRGPQSALSVIQPSNLPLLRILLGPDARNYRAVSADVQGDRATVHLQADVPVNFVLRAMRQGPGWAIDLSRPVLPLEVGAADSLETAAAIADQVTCQEQLQQLGRAMQMYTAASGGLLPDAAGWLDKLREFMPEAPSLHCPSDPKAGISYAYNANLEGKRQAEIASPATTPMVFASTLHGTNPADTGESWPDTVRHPDGNMVLFVDGTVRPVLRKPRFDVTLRPPQPPSARAPRAPSLRVPRQ